MSKLFNWVDFVFVYFEVMNVCIGNVFDIYVSKDFLVGEILCMDFSFFKGFYINIVFLNNCFLMCM